MLPKGKRLVPCPFRSDCRLSLQDSANDFMPLCCRDAHCGTMFVGLITCVFGIRTAAAGLRPERPRKRPVKMTGRPVRRFPVSKRRPPRITPSTQSLKGRPGRFIPTPVDIFPVRPGGWTGPMTGCPGPCVAPPAGSMASSSAPMRLIQNNPAPSFALSAPAVGRITTTMAAR